MSATAAPSAIADNPWLAQRAQLVAVTPELPGVSTYHLRFRDPRVQDAYHFLPGQFNMVYLPGVGEAAISVSGANAQRGTWDHTIRVAGNGARSLAARAPGLTLVLRGP